MVWASYGFVKGDEALIPVNIIGMITQILYTLCFFMYCKDKVCIHKCAVNMLVLQSIHSTKKTNCHRVYHLKKPFPFNNIICTCVTLNLWFATTVSFNVIVLEAGKTGCNLIYYWVDIIDCSVV